MIKSIFKSINLGIGHKIYIVMFSLILIAVSMAVSTNFMIGNISNSTAGLAQHTLPEILKATALNKDSAKLVNNTKVLIQSQTKEELSANIEVFTHDVDIVTAEINALNIVDEEKQQLVGSLNEIKELGATLSSIAADRIAGKQKLVKIIEEANLLQEDLSRKAAPLYDDAEFNLVIVSEDLKSFDKVIQLGNIEQAVTETNAEHAQALKSLKEKYEADIAQQSQDFESVKQELNNKVQSLSAQNEALNSQILELEKAVVEAAKTPEEVAQPVIAPTATEEIQPTAASIEKQDEATSTPEPKLEDELKKISPESGKDQPINLKEIGDSIEKDVASLANTLKYIAELNLVIGYYNTAAGVKSVEELIPLQDKFTASKSRLKGYLNTDNLKHLAKDTEKLLAYGEGEESIFAIEQMQLERLGEAAYMEEILLAVVGDVDANINAKLQEIEENASNSGSEAVSQSQFIQTTVVGSSIVLVILGLAISLFYVRPYIVKRLISIYDSTSRIADGDMSTEIKTSGNDELSKIATALITFKDNIMQNQKLEEEQKLNTERQEQAAMDERLRLASEFEQLVGTVVSSLKQSVSEMEGMANMLDQSMQETTGQSEVVANVASSASSNVDAVAAAAEELTSSIQDIAVNVSDTAETAQQCAHAAATSQERLSVLQLAVNDIDGVIQAINDVAEQTNLLALNATIEAARAGEAGKGFAVVANEVKTLATQTHKMTDEISEKVAEIKSSASGTIESVESIINQISAVDEKSASVAAAVEQQNASTSEISHNAQEAARGTNEVSDNIGRVQTVAQESAEATGQLKQASSSLSEQTASLEKAVDAFLKEIRQA